MQHLQVDANVRTKTSTTFLVITSTNSLASKGQFQSLTHYHSSREISVLASLVSM